MALEITRPEVLNNLIRFKDNLLEKREGSGSFHSERTKTRVYPVLLNRRTGDMRFAEKITNLESRISAHGKKKGAAEDWKEIRITVEEESNRIRFEATDAEGRPIHPKDLEALSWQIASETIEILNLMGKEVPQTLGSYFPEEYILRDLSKIHLASDQGRIEDLPGWNGHISRIEAEKKLSESPVGTYVLREGDELTMSITFHLEEENHIPLHTYILTVVEKEEKISDYLILHTNKGWTLYHDEPDLQQYQFHSTAHSLMGAMRHTAKTPL
ncbi:MAG: hypothetical protein JSS32_10250 [Verrucomicrobia bacterium]|nr:hypothetical protein [Verrucomicrobiota bacterium]